MRPGASRRETEITPLRERDVHRRERHLHEMHRRIAVHVPRTEWTREPGAKTERVGKAERRVVPQVGVFDIAQVPVRIDAKVVVALSGHARAEPTQNAEFALDLRWIVGRGVRAMEPDLGAAFRELVDEAPPQSLVGLRRCAVVRVAVSRKHEERAAGRTAPSRPVDDLAEAPVRIRPKHPMDRRKREPDPFAHCSAHTAVQQVVLCTCRSAAKADARPPPRSVDVVGQRDPEPGAVPALRFDTEPRAETFERRVERIEHGPRSAEATVLVARSADLLQAREMEERIGEVVALWPFEPFDRIPRILAIRHVVAEADLRRADRVEDPARPPLDSFGDQLSAALAKRAAWTNAGFGSSRANTASTYGGLRNTGGSPASRVIAHRFPSPFISAGGTDSPTRSAYAIRGRSTPHAAASPCHCQRRGLISISRYRPSRASRLSSTCERPLYSNAPSRRSAASTTSCTQTASPTRHVPIPRGAWRSFRPQKTPSARPSS